MTAAEMFVTPGLNTAIRIAPMPARFLESVRLQGIDDQGQHVKRVIAEGGEPCRDVLRRAVPGEELILASFSPFSLPGPYREYGPVFVLAQPGVQDVGRDELPIEGPLRYLRDQFVIRAYSRDEQIADAVMTGPAEAPSVIEGFLGSPRTAFLHVRFPTYGCFACRIDRA